MITINSKPVQSPTTHDKDHRSQKKKRKEGWWSRFLKRLAETNQREGVCRT